MQTGNRKLNSRENDLRTVRTTNQPSLSVLLSYFAAPESRPRQGDVVEVEAGRFDVVSARPDGAGRIDLQLVRAPV